VNNASSGYDVAPQTQNLFLTIRKKTTAGINVSAVVFKGNFNYIIIS
jgi:hypothetical protein